MIASGTAVKCPDNSCDGIVFQNSAYNNEHPWNPDLYRRTFNGNININCLGANPNWECSISTWSMQYVQGGGGGYLGPNDVYSMGPGFLNAGARAIFSQVARNTGVMTTGKFWLEAGAASALAGDASVGFVGLQAAYGAIYAFGALHPEALVALYDVINVLSPGPSIPETALGWYFGLDERVQH